MELKQVLKLAPKAEAQRERSPALSLEQMEAARVVLKEVLKAATRTLNYFLIRV